VLPLTQQLTATMMLKALAKKRAAEQQKQDTGAKTLAACKLSIGQIPQNMK